MGLDKMRSEKIDHVKHPIPHPPPKKKKTEKMIHSASVCFSLISVI